MGLYIHSLEEFPVTAERGYYLYLLNGGWGGDLERALTENFQIIGDLASRSGAVAMMGSEGKHFQNEVFSWHHLNGQEAEELLPAVLITTIHPRRFLNEQDPFWSTASRSDHLLLLPLRSHCKTADDVGSFIRKVFSDIREHKELKNFEVVRGMKPSTGKAILEGFILKPSFMGVGFDLRSLATLFQRK